MTITTLPKPTIQQRAERVADRRLPGRLARFIDGPDVGDVSARLRGLVSRAEYLRMQPEERRAALRPAHIEQEIARIASVEAAPPALAPAQGPIAAMQRASASQPATVAEPATGAKPEAEPERRERRVTYRYLVPCWRGCGRLLGVPGPRPVLRYCCECPVPKKRARR